MGNKAPTDYPREIERRFLIETTPDLTKCDSTLICQGYLTGAPTSIRLRSSSRDGYFLTVKRGSQGNHEEREIPLTEAQFDSLWPMTAGHRIRKTRHRIPHGKLTVELDVFHDKHEGLKIAEVEFPDPEAAAAFEPLEWFGHEVSEDIRYANVTLAME